MSRPSGAETPGGEKEAREELPKQGTELEDGNRTWELPDEAEEEPLQGGTELLNERNEAKEELLPQGTKMEDVPSNPQPHLNTARTPTTSPT